MFEAGRAKGWLLLAALALAACAEGIVFSNARSSPRNRERAIRKETLYIILHTTEGPTGSSLNKLTANGECHYLVDTSGKIWRIVDVRREAYHCGLSMWKGRTNLDSCSIGIEVTGFHNRPLTAHQYTALRELLKQLRFRYKIAPQNVLTHSMVAYGEPNRWQKRRHRGRKRCGMLYAQNNIRAKLGLTAKYGADPDVRAGRLRVGDDYLERVLYGGAMPVGSGFSSVGFLETRHAKPPAELPLSAPSTSAQKNPPPVPGPPRRESPKPLDKGKAPVKATGAKPPAKTTAGQVAKGGASAQRSTAKAPTKPNASSGGKAAPNTRASATTAQAKGGANPAGKGSKPASAAGRNVPARTAPSNSGRGVAIAKPSVNNSPAKGGSGTSGRGKVAGNSSAPKGGTRTAASRADAPVRNVPPVATRLDEPAPNARVEDDIKVRRERPPELDAVPPPPPL